MKTTIQLLIPRTVKLAFVIIILAVFDPAALSQKANSNSQPGSILFFNRYTSDPNNPQLSDTQINITNTDPIEKAFVHLFFIDGTTGSNADYSISMQPNQTLSFLTSDIDPSVSGYIIAVATDGSVPIQNNSLIGTALITEGDGRQVVLPAFPVAKLSPGRVAREAGDSAILKFDGVEYEQLPGTVAVTNINGETADASSLIVYSPAADLVSGSLEMINIYSLFFDEAQRSIPSNFSVRGYKINPLSAFFNRPGISLLQSPLPKRGWIRLSAGSRPILGSFINKANVLTSSYNLPSLTLLPSYEIRVPAY